MSSLTAVENPLSKEARVEPLCPVYGLCGGCAFQHVDYAAELKIKEARLREQMQQAITLDPDVFESIVASPTEYHYRHRLDITLKKTKSKGVLFGYQPQGQRMLVEVDACPIARKEVSDFLPQLRQLAIERLPEDYRTANLVVRTSDDGRVFWGGIGRRSLSMKSEDYFWTEINGRRIHFSLETFFQANLGILPRLMKKIEEHIPFSKSTVFFDLYAGVGLFGIYFAERVNKLILIEQATASVELMKYNLDFYGIKNAEISSGLVEDELPRYKNLYQDYPQVAIVDPPRSGLKPSAVDTLAEMKHLETLLYLSCHPEFLVRDLELFVQRGWKVKRVIPFDFFPKTSHLETLVKLEPVR